MNISKQTFRTLATSQKFYTGRNVVLVDGTRTPFVKSLNEFNGVWQYDLLSKAYSSLLQRNPQVNPSEIERVTAGCVVMTVDTSNVAREAALAAGIPYTVPANTVTLACISGCVAAQQCVDLIRNGDIDIAIAGGVESMSDVPILWPRKTRNWLLKYGQKMQGLTGPKGFFAARKKFNGPIGKMFGLETMGIADFSSGEVMGHSCDRLAAAFGISREEQDHFAYVSHRNALQAQENGKLSDVIKVFLPGGTGPISKDGGIFPNLEKASKLKPAFIKPHGTITAANASWLTDGAAACLLMSEEKALALGLKPKAYIREQVITSTDPVDECLLGPSYATSKVLLRANKQVSDIDVWEIHEAFAGVVLANVKAMGSDDFCKRKIPNREAKVGDIDFNKVNQCGGSVSIGHPFGATGIRLLTQAANRLQDEGSRYGLVTACAASGHAYGGILERYPN